MTKAFRSILARALAGAALVAPMASAGQAAPILAPGTHRVGFDGHSFLIDGERTYLWSGEFHPYRLPSPALWIDIFQKMRAAGFNTVSIYFSWGYHSAREGEYDFTGIRDMDRVLDAARDAGLYVIARPGPYINAEVDSGGFPLWLTTKDIHNRSTDPAYLRYGDEWLTQIDRILARHQLADGRGTVIAYQIENEFYDGSAAGRAYMHHLQDKARADGIVVPLVGNHDGTFVNGEGAMEVSGWDHYPQAFDCSNPTRWKAAPDMSAERGPGQPGFAAEFQGGAFDPWGGPGYAKCAELINDRFANVFYKKNIAAGVTAQNFYMIYGGTSWGWQAIPQNYTSYDYGAAITEGRQFDPKYYEDKRIGYLVTSLPSLLKTDASTPARVEDPTVIDTARLNPDTGTQFHLIGQGDTRSNASASIHIALSLKEGRYLRVPQQPGTAITLDGRDSKLLVADADLGKARLVYSTSELMTQATIDGRDVAVFYGLHGSAGETVLRYAKRPTVQVVSGSVEQHWDAHGDLRLNYAHDGVARVLVTGGERPLLLLLADKPATERLWRQETARGPVLMLGSHLLRSAAFDGDTLALTGDGDGDGTAEILAPAAKQVTWNGAPIATRATESGGLAVMLPTPRAIVLPALDHWTSRPGAPEIETGFDDSQWPVADQTHSASITKPGTLPVLFADDYGFHTGNTWYRGHFDGSANAPTGLRLKVLSGANGGAFSVWLNGQFLGSVTSGDEGSFSFPAAMIRRGDNVVSVLTVNMGHEEDYHSKGENRSARGIVAATPLGAAQTSIRWRLQGRSEIDGAMPLRGPYNDGGLSGERLGWPTAKGNDPAWKPATLPAKDATPGVTWYRTDVTLDLPRDQDSSIGVVITDPPARHYRATLFVNGWQMGNYVADLGPQHSFPIPAGVLHEQGANSITLAVWNTDTTPGGLGTVSLVNYGSYASAPRQP
jgi:beta-galactosidase GanA